MTRATVLGIVVSVALSSYPAAGSHAADLAEFDPTDSVEPPSAIDIRDVYELVESSRSDDQRADLMEALVATPDGQISRLRITTAEFDALAPGNSGSQQAHSGSDEEDESPRPPELDPGDPLPESVIGRDTRERVTNTALYPYRAIGRIELGCTGTLIGPRHVLTAGHCIYNTRTDRWYSSIKFSPGQNASQRPYGKLDWTHAITVKGWVVDHLRNYDVAMIVLGEDVGTRSGWLGFGFAQNLPADEVNVNGYPGDKPTGTLWHSACPIGLERLFRLYYVCDTFGGNSGSGVYRFLRATGERTIWGIHAYGVDSTGMNGATRIRRATYAALRKWIHTY